MRRKKRKQWKRTRARPLPPPLTAAAAAALYVVEEELGVYDDSWRNMGYSVEHGGAVPPISRQQKRRNNRSSNWNGIFAFTFILQEIDVPTREALFQSLTRDYGCELLKGGMPGQWEGQALLNGRRVKTLTRLLNRHFSRGYLVWKERPSPTPLSPTLPPP
jgi:hypothetical protein